MHLLPVVFDFSQVGWRGCWVTTATTNNNPKSYSLQQIPKNKKKKKRNACSLTSGTRVEQCRVFDNPKEIQPTFRVQQWSRTAQIGGEEEVKRREEQCGAKVLE